MDTEQRGGSDETDTACCERCEGGCGRDVGQPDARIELASSQLRIR